MLPDNKMFVFTFGAGQVNEGKCQPIIAKSMQDARLKMIDMYGTNWSMAYTGEDWNRAVQDGTAIEKPRKAVYA